MMLKTNIFKFKITKVGNVLFNTKKNSGLWHLNLDVEIRIKNEKVRFDIILNDIVGSSGEIPIAVSQSGISNNIFKKEELRKGYDIVKKTVDDSLNNFVFEISNSITGNGDYKKMIGKI